MIKNILISVLLVAISACASNSKSKPEASAEFKIRPYEKQRLANGLEIFWVADNSLPYVAFQMLVKSGSGQDPVGKEGLAAMTSALLSKGTAKRSANQISEDLEQIGSSFDADVEPDYTTLGASSLSFNKSQLLKEFSEILLTPTFPEVELERRRALVLGGLRKLADRPQQFSEYLMPKFMFGGHPYGHEASGTPSSVKGLKRADVQKFFERNYVPGNALLAVVGQYDAAFRKELVTALSKWKGKESTPAQMPAFPAWKGTELLLVDRPDLNQAQIQIGFKGVPRKIPEYMELRAALKVLGESFGSRLFDEIREKRGLTYHIHAWFDPRLIEGPMGIYTFTRTDKIGETVEETLKVYRGFVKDGITDSEVSDVKALMRGQFPRIFETPEALAQQLLVLNLYGVPPEYLTGYLAYLDAMTKESINASIRKYFDAANLKILVYAPREKAEATMRKLGKVEIKGYKEFLN